MQRKCAVDRPNVKPNDASQAQNPSEKLIAETQGTHAGDNAAGADRGAALLSNIVHNLVLESLIGKGYLPAVTVEPPDRTKAENGKPPEGTKPAEVGNPEVGTKPADKSKSPEPPNSSETAKPPAHAKSSEGIRPAEDPKAPKQPEATKQDTTVQPHEGGEQTSATTRALYNLDHRSSDAKTPDAMVVIPPNFDKNKPINLMIYNHGWYDTASSSLKNAHLEEQMKNAPPNTVLIVPEWQQKPGSGGRGTGASNEGQFGDENFVSGMVQDVFNHTPELKGKTLADVNHVGIVSHSAGYVPTESELYNNPELAKKVNSVTMLDSLYDKHGLDKWIHENIADLSDGKKHYQNIFHTSTAKYSEIQSQFVAQELQKYSGTKNQGSELIDRSSGMLTTEQLRKYPIVFKATSMRHMVIPTKYVSVVEEAADR
jgi:hypothetical protein